MNLLKNGLSLSSGALLASILSFLLSPILTRIYSPENFGLGESVNVYAALLSVIFTMRLDTAFVVASDQNEKNQLFTTILFSNLIFSVIAFVCFLLFSPNEFIYYYLAIPVLAIITSVYESGIWILNSHNKYSLMAKYKVLLILSIVLFKIAFGHIYDGVWSILIATFIAKILVTSSLFFKLVTVKMISVNFEISVIRGIIAKYSNIIKNVLPVSVLGLGRESLLNVLILSFWGSSYVGLYILGVKLLSLPVNILGNSISNVIYQQASEFKKEKKGLNKIYVKFSNICIFVLGLFIFGNIICPYIIPILFGKNWSNVSSIILSLSPLYFSQFIFATIEKLAIIEGIEKKILGISIVSEVLSLFGLLICFKLNMSIYSSLLIFAILNIAPRIIFLIKFKMKKINSHPSEEQY